MLEYLANQERQTCALVERSMILTTDLHELHIQNQLRYGQNYPGNAAYASYRPDPTVIAIAYRYKSGYMFLRTDGYVYNINHDRIGSVA